MIFRTLLSVTIIGSLISCTSSTVPKMNPEIQTQDILDHISFLASDSLQGREAGTLHEATAANYIADYFRDFGLEPAGDNETYFQTFTINTAVLNNPHATEDSEGEKRLSKNVVGYLQGTGGGNEYIVIGAHYDHLGLGDHGSLYRGEPRIHNGADDNASGTAGLLELANYFAANKPTKDILFIAFSGEEMGLLGSAHYVESPTIPLENALAMINMDMIGRMSNNKLLIFGMGTAADWPEIMEVANTDSLSLNLVKDGTGASDHTSFYYKNIPVLHYFTDTHADYHKPSDDTDYINVEGEALILHHIKRVVEYLDSIKKEQLAFQEAPGKQRQTMRLEGPTLGVLPDYGYDGKGMKITGVTKDRAAELAGVKGGDIIIKIGGEDLDDIYAYMSMLNKLEKGQKTTITVLRDGNELTLDLQL